MKKYQCLLILFFGLQAHGGQDYILDLKPERWNFNPGMFYISEIVDDRSSKKGPGKVLVEDKAVDAKFKVSLEADIKNMIDGSIDQDTSQIPLILSFEKFAINETGTREHHKVVFEFGIKFYRLIKGKRYQVYEVNGRPEMDIRGPFPFAHEKNIREAIKRTIEGLNKWLEENPDQQLLARKLIVIMEPASKLNLTSDDTLLWNKSYQLLWPDFKGKPDNGSSFMAQSNCLFTFRAEPMVKHKILELHINMHAGFDKNSSWVKPGQQKDTLLAHERLHFDICEFYVRQLRNKIRSLELDLVEYDKQIRESFEIAWSNYQAEQRRYDDETEHGLKSADQLRWQSEIQNKLQ